MRKFLQSAIFVDILSCVLLAIGLGHIISLSLSLPGGLLSCLVLAGISTGLVFIFYLRHWTIPVILSAVIGISVFYYYLSGWHTSKQLFSLNDYWLMLAHYPLFFKSVFIFALCLLLFALIRRVFFFPIFPLLIGIAFCCCYYYSHARSAAALAISVAGLILLIPRIYANHTRLYSKCGITRSSMQLVAIPAAILAPLMSFWLIPVDTGAWRLQGISNFITDVWYLAQNPFYKHPKYSTNFSMAQMGFQAESGKLGGSVKLSDEKYLMVRASQPALLRGAVLDYYTGEDWWIGAPDGDFRYKSVLMEKYRNQAFDLDKPLGGSEAQKLYDKLTAKENITIYYENGSFSTIFAAGKVENVELSKVMEIYPVYFNMRSLLYRHYLVPKRAEVKLQTRIWNIDNANDFLRLEKLAANNGDTVMEGLYKRYTDLPQQLPPETIALAKSITLESETPYQKALAINHWLADNCQYTLEPPLLPEGSDFVTHFLEIRKGYCVHYASAMTVLARCVGLPARYVTGFALEMDKNNYSTFYATGKTAHAWTEIYFDGIGWVEFDPLSWDVSAPINQNPSWNLYGDLPARHREAINGQQLESSTGNSIKRLVYITIAIILAIGFSSLCVIRLMGRKLRAYSLTKVRRKFSHTGRQLDFYFADNLKQLNLLGYRMERGETVLAFAERIDRQLKLKVSFKELANESMLLHFAENSPLDNKIEIAYSYHLELEHYLRQSLGKFIYFFHRAIM